MTEARASRPQIAAEWHKRSQDLLRDDDMFSSFVAGYIALVALSAQTWSDNRGSHEPPGHPDTHEFKKISFAATCWAERIYDALRDPPTWQHVQSLRDRRVPDSECGRIMGAHGDGSLERSLQTLSNLWVPRGGNATSEDKRSEASLIVELLREARNRLFHGEKRYNADGRDADLFRLLCPVLSAVVGSMLDAMERR